MLTSKEKKIAYVMVFKKNITSSCEVICSGQKKRLIKYQAGEGKFRSEYVCVRQGFFLAPNMISEKRSTHCPSPKGCVTKIPGSRQGKRNGAKLYTMD